VVEKTPMTEAGVKNQILEENSMKPRGGDKKPTIEV
jgi:hypothetical protein